MSNNRDREHRQKLAGTKSAAAVAVAVVVLVIGLANFLLVKQVPGGALAATTAALMLALVVIGINVNGRPSGVLIDNRNRISLSKFQMVMWTILVIASVIVIASHNLMSSTGDGAVGFTIPTALLSAMGISAGSFVSTPIILSLKTDQAPTSKDAEAAAAKTTQAGTGPDFAGKVFARANPRGAAWTDMLVGEEVGNFDTPDLGKIQQLFISILLVGIYGFAVWNSLTSTPDPIGSLPPLSDSFVWLVAISHASYLAYKAAPHTADGDSMIGQSDPARLAK